MNGSTARPTQYPTYVGRYDLYGNRVWFKEFLHGTTNTPSASIAIALDPSGNLVVVTGGVHAEGSYIVRLNAADGTLL